MKIFLQNKVNIFLCLFFIVILIFLIDIKLWPWYVKQPEKEEFNSEIFFDNLKVISWTILKWPSNDLYSRYWEFLKNTDKYLKL
jgi:hypothetical protein